MTRYRNMFYDKNGGKLVSVALSLEEMIIEPEDTTGGNNSQQIEFDIKNGYQYDEGHSSQAYEGAPLLYELPTNGAVTAEDIAEYMNTDPEMESGHRGVRGAFQVLFNNYIKTCMPDRGRTRGGKTRFWYNVSGGTVSTYKKSSRGLKMNHLLMSRGGELEDNLRGFSLLPNVYSSGDSCHWGLQEVDRWRNNAGKDGGDPDTLTKSHELFQAGVGNNDLTGSNFTKTVENSEMKMIIEEFKTEYVNNIEHDGMRRKFLTYIVGFIDGLEENGLGNYHEHNTNQLASILEHTPNFYIEDYL